METGIVKEIINNKEAVIKIENIGECESCSGKSFCSVFTSKDNMMEVNYNEDLKIGDQVEVHINSKNRIISSIIIFLMPIIILILSYYINLYFFKKEIIAIIGALIGFILYFIVTFFYFRSKKELKNLKPFVTKI